MTMVLWVALGGGLGAVARYLTGGLVGAWIGTGFPWGTMTVNVVGALVLGVVIELSALAWSPSEGIRAFLVVGLLGGFTTFSAFTMDVVLLAERGRYDLAGLYALGSVALALAGLLAGLRLTRAILM